MILTCVVTVACNSVVLVYLEDYDGYSPKTQVYNPDEPLPTPKRDGYVFGGWYTDSELTKLFAEGTKMESNFHLYAKWTPKSNDNVTDSSIEITFVYCDGVTANKVVKGTAGLPFSSVLSSVSTPSRKDYRFDGWWTAETGGEQMLSSTLLTKSIPVYAHWTYTGGSQGGGGDDTPHTTHDFGDSYFMYVKCSNATCDVYGRNEGSRNYDNMFNFTTAKGNEAKSSLTKCQNYLKSGGNVDGFLSLHEELEQELNYVDEQYYWASLYGNVNENFNYYSIDQVYNDLFEGFCKLCEAIDETYGEDFWNKYDGDKEDCLELARLYGDNSNSSEADGILSQYETEMKYNNPNMTTINNLYGQFVAVNNNVAKAAGYNNYMDYAYEAIYNREYKPSQVASMRQYIKQYIAPLLTAIANKMDGMQKYDSKYGYYYEFEKEVDEEFYSALIEASMFESTTSSYYKASQTGTNLIGEYFTYLSSKTAGKKEINFYSAVNDLFKNGNYFTGTGEGAYTMWIPYTAQMPVVYFEASTDYDYGYDTAFTFVHEFGHYYENIYNGGLELSYDHDETHSQGDEMLFLAWLRNNLPTGVSDGFTAVELDQLFDMLSNIVMSYAVDELEQAAYTGTYNGREITGNYGDLFNEILSYYIPDLVQDGWLNTDYWAYVVFDSAAYYISYSVSALPAVELYAVACTQGLNTARDMYFKLFTFSEDQQVMEDYSYINVLNYCGLGNPFEQDLYKVIADFVGKLY